MNRGSTCGRMIKFITVSIEKKMNASLKGQDLTAGQGLLLMYLKKNGASSMKDLEKQFHLSQPTVVGLVRRVEKKGLVTTFSKEGDKRVKMVQITEAGMEKCDAAVDTERAIESELTEGMTEKEAEVLEILLKKVCVNLGADEEGNFLKQPPEPPPIPSKQLIK